MWEGRHPKFNSFLALDEGLGQSESLIEQFNR